MSTRYYRSGRKVGSEWQPFYAKILFETQREVRDLKKRVAVLESEWAPIENLGQPEKVKVGMRGLFGEL